jgi:hypothetical protein
MGNNSASLLAQFIKDNGLKTPDGIISFKARINITGPGQDHSLYSEVQVLNLPGMMAVYIIEKLDEKLQIPDMFTTVNHNFEYASPAALKIISDQSGTAVTILPVLGSA